MVLKCNFRMLLYNYVKNCRNNAKSEQIYHNIRTFRPQLHDTRLLSERHQILVFQGAFRT